MKKLFLIVAALFVAVSFSACSDDDDKDVSIVGTWQLVRVTGFETNPYTGEREEFDNDTSSQNKVWIFKADGTGVDDGDPFTYSIKDQSLTWTYVYDQPTESDDTEPQIETIRKLTVKELELYNYNKSDDNTYEISTTRYFIRK